MDRCLRVTNLMLNHFHPPKHISSFDRESSRPQEDCVHFLLPIRLSQYFGLSVAFVRLPPALQEVSIRLQKPFHKMPRIAVDTASAGLLSGEVDMSTASIAQMVKENVDLGENIWRELSVCRDPAWSNMKSWQIQQPVEIKKNVCSTFCAYAAFVVVTLTMTLMMMYITLATWNRPSSSLWTWNRPQQQSMGDFGDPSKRGLQVSTVCWICRQPLPKTSVPSWAQRK